MTLPVTVASIPNHPVEDRLPQPHTTPHHSITMLECAPPAHRVRRASLLATYRVLPRRRVLLHDRAASDVLRTLRGVGTPRNSAVFIHPDLPDDAVDGHSAVLNLPFLYHPTFNGTEPVRHLTPNAGDMVAIQWVRIDLHTCQQTPDRG